MSWPLTTLGDGTAAARYMEYYSTEKDVEWRRMAALATRLAIKPYRELKYVISLRALCFTVGGTSVSVHAGEGMYQIFVCFLPWLHRKKQVLSVESLDEAERKIDLLVLRAWMERPDL